MPLCFDVTGLGRKKMEKVEEMSGYSKLRKFSGGEAGFFRFFASLPLVSLLSYIIR